MSEFHANSRSCRQVVSTAGC